MGKKVCAVLLMAALVLPSTPVEAATLGDLFRKVIGSNGKVSEENVEHTKKDISDEEDRLARIKLRQLGVQKGDSDILAKIDMARELANEKVKNSLVVKSLELESRTREMHRENLVGQQEESVQRLQQEGVKKLGKSEEQVEDVTDTEMQLFKEIEDQRVQEIAATKKRVTDFDTLRQANEEAQRVLDQELNAILTPTEKAEVGSIEADYLYELEEIERFPRDPHVNNQWELGSVLSQFEDHFVTPSSTSTPRVVVAIIDSGVDYTHEDLVGHIYNPSVCYDETGTTTPNGCPYGGWDFVDDDNDPSPTSAIETHGTRIAGLIAAQNDSGLGIASLSNNLVDIMPIRVTGDNHLELSKIVDAIYFAVENGADVINMSFAGPTFSQTLYDAIEYAEQNGVIVVAAAGNYGTNVDTSPIYPASYNLDNIISVGALNINHTLASFSNYGLQSVDFAAPGVALTTTDVNNSYTTVSGTSFAAAVTSAMAGALIAQGSDPLLVFSQLEQSPTLVQQTIGGKVLGFPMDLPPTEPLPLPLPNATATDPLFGDYYLNAEGGASSQLPQACTNEVTSLYPPQLLAPGTSGSYLAASGPTIWFYWNLAAGANGYGLYIYNASTSAMVHTTTGLTGSPYSAASSILQPGGYYRWNMRSLNGSTCSRVSTDYKFYIPLTTPNTPQTYSPGYTTAPGEPLTSTSQTFQWQDVGADKYYITIWDRSYARYHLTAYQVNGTSVSISNLEAGHSYEWSVQACTNSGVCSIGTNSRYFSIGSVNGAPNVPGVYGNATNSVTQNVPYTITLHHYYDPDHNPVKFDVKWYSGSSIETTSSFIAEGNYDTLAHTYSTPGTYCIQARAYDGQGSAQYSAWSPCHNVTVTASTSGGDLVGELRTASDVLGAGDNTTLTYNVKNIGDATVTTNFDVHFFLSRDAFIDVNNDVYLGAETVSTDLSSGASTTLTKAVPMPDPGHSVYRGDGDYYIGIYVDATGVATEGNESNNKNRGIGTDVRSVYINETTSGGLTFTVTTSGSYSVGNPFTVSVVANQSSYNGAVQLTASLGNLSKQSIQLTSGSGSASTTINTAGKVNISASGGGGSGKSNDFTVTGGANTGGVVIVVKDQLKNPVLGADVSLVCGRSDSTCSGGASYVQTTSADGKADFGSIVSAGDYQIVIQHDGITTDGGNVTVGPFGIAFINKTFVVPTDDNLTPMVFIPGIPGSTMKYADPFIPVLADGKVRAEDLRIFDFAGKSSPIGLTDLGWNEMIEAFANEYGFRDGSSIIRCPWDWRMKSEEAAVEFLQPCIDKALSLNPGRTKVDIVAHSMGGLVTRAYVQGGGYRNDIRKVAFIATPHTGGTNAYNMWGGVANDLPSQFIVARQVRSTEFNETQDILKSFANPLVYISSGLTSLGLSSNQAYVSSYVRNNVKSVEQLLPTYPFLVEKNTLNLKELNFLENDFLKSLNGQTCINDGCGSYAEVFSPVASKFGSTTGKVQAKVFANSGFYSGIVSYTYTPYQILVGDSSEYFEDGAPVLQPYGQPGGGDGTVLYGSATWLKDNAAGVELEPLNNTTNHMNLPGAFMKQVGEYLTGQAFTTSSFELEAMMDDEPTMTLDLKGSHQPLLTLPNGTQVGVDAGDVIETATNIKFMEITEDGSSITLGTPVAGTYTLTLAGALAKDFDFYLDYVSETHQEAHMYDMLYDGSTTTITFALDPSAPAQEQAIEFPNVSRMPQDVTATKQSSSTLLSWDAPTGTAPTSYNVYSRPVENTLLAYLGQATSTSYATGHTWAGSNLALMRRYQVSAVYANGEESFLSGEVYNNDEDQDGLPDHLEVQEGSTIGDTDSDNDGLLDGEEYFNYGTDPTLADTDGDGTNDYDEVHNGTATSTAGTGAQLYTDGLENGWAEYGSWNLAQGGIDYASTQQVAQGSIAIKIPTNGTWGGMWIRNAAGINTTGYETLRFAFHPGGTLNHTPKLQFYDENHQAIFVEVSMKDYITEDISAGLQSKWYDVVIPLADLDVTNEVVGDLLFITSNTATFYIDNMHFSAQSETPVVPGVVYDNAFQNGWQQSGSWSIGYSSTSTATTSQNSSNAIRLTYNAAWGGLALTSATTVPGSMYDSLHVAYNPGSTGGQTDYIKLRNQSSQDLTANYISLDDYVTGTPQVNRWYQIDIPLTALGASTSTVKDMIFLGSAATTIHLDDIRFVPKASTSTVATTSAAIYGEGLVTPWLDGGKWSATTTYNFNQAKTGIYGLKAEYGAAWAGHSFSASTSINTAAYDTLSIGYNPGATTSQALYVKLRGASGQELAGYKAFSSYNSSMPANQWSTVTIPLSALATSTNLIKHIDFTTSQGATVYFDDVRFTASTTPVASSTQVKVYEDFFLNSFTHGGGWLSTTTYTSSTRNAGVYGIAVQYTTGSWSDNAFSASVPIDTTGMDTLHVAYNPGANATTTIHIKTRNESGADHNPNGFITLNTYVSNPIANTWYDIEIPFADLSIASGEKVKDIIFTTNNGGTIYLDDVYFGQQQTGGGATFEGGMISLSFDDGWLTHYTQAKSILDAEGIDGTFYIVSQETLLANELYEQVLNPSLETASSTSGYPANWQKNYWGTHNATFTYPVAGAVGTSSARVEMSSYTDGDAKWFFDDVNVYDNNEYTISYQYRSSTSTTMFVRYTMDDNSISYLTATTSPASGGSWATTTVTVLTPVNVKSLTVFPALASVGYLEVDAFSVKRNQIYVNPTQVLALQTAGHEIGAHTQHHEALTTVSTSTQETEIAGSRTDLLNMGVSTVSNIAYPYGDYNTNVQAITQNAGYTAGRSTDRGYNYPNTNKYALKIQQVDRTTTLADIQNWITTAKQDDTWLILMFHQIDSNTVNTLGATSAFLQEIVDYIDTADIDVVTVGQGVGLME